MVLELPPTIWVATAPINLRLSFDRLAGIVRSELGGDPKQARAHGGPLVDAEGKMLGLITLNYHPAKFTGIAIPVHVLKSEIDQMLKEFDSGIVVKREPGVVGITAEESPDRSGVYIVDVAAGGPAEKAGLRVGDRILRIGDQRDVAEPPHHAAVRITALAVGERHRDRVLMGVAAVRDRNLAALAEQRVPLVDRRQVRGEEGEDREIGLGLGVKTQPDRTLHSDDCRITCLRHERAISAIDAGAMTRTNRRHRDDLAVDELDAVFPAQDPGLPHPLVVVGGEPLSADCNRHRLRAILARTLASSVPRV